MTQQNPEDRDKLTYNPEGKVVHEDGETGATGPVPFESVTTEELNNVSFADAADGAAAVQSEVDAVGSDATVYVYSSQDPVEWTESVRVPDGVTLESWGDFTIQIPSDHNITPKQMATGTEEMAAVLTNKDWTNGNQNVRIEGFDVDVNGVSDGTSESWAGAVLYRCDPESRLKNITAENVAGDSELVKVGTLLLRCDRSKMVDCTTRNCGYEGYGIMGGTGCEAIRCHDEDSTVHAGQIHADLDDPREDAVSASFRGCSGDGKLIVHGSVFGQGCRDATFDGCDALYTQIIGHVRGVKVCDPVSRGSAEDVSIRTTTETAGIEISDVTIEGLSTEGRGPDSPSRAVKIETQADGSVIRDVNIESSEIIAGQVVRIEDDDTTGSEITNIRVNDTEISEPDGYSYDSSIVWMSGTDDVIGNVWADGIYADVSADVRGGGTRNMDFFSLINSDLSDVDDVGWDDVNIDDVNRQNNIT